VCLASSTAQAAPAACSVPGLRWARLLLLPWVRLAQVFVGCVHWWAVYLPPTVESGVGRLSRSAPPAFAAPPTQAAAEVVAWQSRRRRLGSMSAPGQCCRHAGCRACLSAKVVIARAVHPCFCWAFARHGDGLMVVRMGARSVGSTENLAVWHSCKSTQDDCLFKRSLQYTLGRSPIHVALSERSLALRYTSQLCMIRMFCLTICWGVIRNKRKENNKEQKKVLGSHPEITVSEMPRLGSGVWMVPKRAFTLCLSSEQDRAAYGLAQPPTAATTSAPSNAR
jgi:hypothetical protein